MNAKKTAIAGRGPNNRWMVFWSVVLVLAIAAFIANVVMIFRDSSNDARYLELAGELRVQSQQMATAAREALAGRDSAFDSLVRARDGFDRALRVLSNGDAGLPSPRPLLGDELSVLGRQWTQLEPAANGITENREQILFLHDVARNLNASIPTLQQEYAAVVDSLTETGASGQQVALAQRQVFLAERISRNVDRILRGGEDAVTAAEQFRADADNFGKVLDGMLNGNAALRVNRVSNSAARANLNRVDELFAVVSSSVEDIQATSSNLFAARQSADVIEELTPQVQTATSVLIDGIDRLGDARPLNDRTALIAGAAALISLAMLGWLSITNTRRRLAATAETNDRNQQAILRLLDELAGLADGDLTTTATVSEDFTGAIADAINYTIDQLRVLVSSINTTSMSVSGAAEQTRSTALQLAEASEHQAQEIAGASAAINEMAITIDQVSSNAAESAGVAERSVSLAKSGSEVVQNTIRGMDNIREQIQETAKRIKRLGESSQEIGDIVSLINDIADQTNILALNAAIQASMAGDAGRGFAVVADEVQRLAERSSAATKQIEALVKTIQSDTQEAVISMETTTTEVVRGARLAEDAGVALEEIETVSSHLAELIQNISNAARQQASSAGHISNTMNIIQEITSQTSSGTTATAQAIGDLSEMTDELRNSVAGFKLPDGPDGARA